MPLFDHFSFLAPYYEQFIRLRDPQQIIRMAKLPIEGALLDAGGGTGRVAQAFQGMASSIIVADISHKMLLQASEKNGLNPLCSHIEQLPFPNDYFERVVMVDTLHHVKNQKETASELWRVLKPGGRLVIEEPDIQSFSVKLIALGEKIALMGSRFIRPEVIETYFSYPKASSMIEKKDNNAWIIIEKSK